MNKWLTLLLLTLVYTPIYSQSDTTYIPYVAYWEVGDEYNFSVSKVKEQWKEDNRIKHDSSTYNAQFKVLQATDSSYLISWTFENQLPPELNLPESLKKQIAGFTNMQVLYETDELGTFIGVQNWEEISLKTQALFSEVIKLMQDVPDSDINNEKLEAAMAPFISIYSSKEGIERLVLGELQYFHYPMGAEFAVKDTLRYQDLLPNMFGGTPIRGDAKVYFEKVDLENSTSLMIQQMTLNPEDTKNTLLDLFKRMNLEENEIEKALANSDFNVSDINKYEFYFYPCVPIKIETKRTTIINIDSEKGKRVDQTIIKLID